MSAYTFDVVCVTIHPSMQEQLSEQLGNGWTPELELQPKAVHEFYYWPRADFTDRKMAEVPRQLPLSRTPIDFKHLKVRQ